MMHSERPRRWYDPGWGWVVFSLLVYFHGFWWGHRAGKVLGQREAEAHCPVRPEDFRVAPDCAAPDGHPVRCDKGLNP